MAVYKDRKRGTWFCVYSYTVNGESKQKKKRGFATKKDAQDWEASQRTTEQIESKTVMELLMEMCQSMDTTPYSTNMKQRWLENHFPYVSEPIDRITRQQLIDWRNGLRSALNAPRTMNQGIGYIKSIFAYANKIYNIPNTAAVLRNYKVDAEEMPTWTPEQFSQFQNACDPKYLPLFTFLYWTGCRRGEALALCKDDIDGNKAKITKAIKHYKNGFLPLKNTHSRRVITIDDKTLSLLDMDSAEPFIFGGKKSMGISSVQRHFTKATKEAGLPPIRIHDLRHSHATVLINNGANIVAISRRLGHASINQTLRTYSHLMQKSDDEMMDIIGTLR